MGGRYEAGSILRPWNRREVTELDGGVFLLLVVIFVIVFKIIASEDKNQRSQWRASSMIMEQKDKDRRMAGTNYSPDTVQGTFVSKEDAGKLNQDFATKKE